MYDTTDLERMRLQCDIERALKHVYDARDIVRDLEDTYGIVFTGNLYASLAYVTNELREHKRDIGGW